MATERDRERARAAFPSVWSGPLQDSNSETRTPRPPTTPPTAEQMAQAALEAVSDEGAEEDEEVPKRRRSDSDEAWIAEWRDDDCHRQNDEGEGGGSRRRKKQVDREDDGEEEEEGGWSWREKENGEVTYYPVFRLWSPERAEEEEAGRDRSADAGSSTSRELEQEAKAAAGRERRAQEKADYEEKKRRWRREEREKAVQQERRKPEEERRRKLQEEESARRVEEERRAAPGAAKTSEEARQDLEKERQALAKERQKLADERRAYEEEKEDEEMRRAYERSRLRKRRLRTPPPPPPSAEEEEPPPPPPPPRPKRAAGTSASGSAVSPRWPPNPPRSRPSEYAWCAWLLKHGVEPNLAERFAAALAANMWEFHCFEEVKALPEGCWRLKVNKSSVFRARADGSQRSTEVWEFRGLHGTTLEGAAGILQQRRALGTRLEHKRQFGYAVHMWGLQNPTAEDVYTLFGNVKGYPDNQAHILFELVCFAKDYAPLTSEGGQAEAIIAGGHVATHFKSRWCLHHEWVQLAAIWLEPQALQGAGVAETYE